MSWTGERERVLVRAKACDVGVEDRGWLIWYGHFEASGAGGQGFGYGIDAHFIKAMLAVFNVERVTQISGRPCYITRTHSKIFKVEPLFANEGTAFDIEQWCLEAQARAEAIRNLDKKDPAT